MGSNSLEHSILFDINLSVLDLTVFLAAADIHLATYIQTTLNSWISLTDNATNDRSFSFRTQTVYLLFFIASSYERKNRRRILTVLEARCCDLA